MTAENFEQNKGRARTGDVIKVLIVDDVKSARDMLSDIIATDSGFQVVATVGDGLEAVEAAMDLQPDLITMDIRLPGQDGFRAVERIIAGHPVPIVMITASLRDHRGTLFKALNAGALDVLDKQELYLWRTRPEIRTVFLRKLRALSQSKVRRGADRQSPVAEILPPVGQPQIEPGASPVVVAIGASTGGPGALMMLFKQIPGNVAASFVVVQHMSRGFLEGLVQWLDAETKLKVKKADEGDLLEPGVVMLAPEDYHVLLTEEGSVRLNKSLPINGHRPSAELLFDSVANFYGRRGVGIILTGMGSDGASGLKRLRTCGGRTIAQDEESSIIFGMPRAAIELGAAEMILPLDEIASQLITWIGEGQQAASSTQP
jgi:two-component system chemotaxis response regulator CheB